MVESALIITSFQCEHFARLGVPHAWWHPLYLAREQDAPTAVLRNRNNDNISSLFIPGGTDN
ncbi:MAG: hypothetical protein F6K39_05410 [Okeania sp. SIO3B3]|nr:hypothetical protein [Okeania sp. SIO3B3]